jgi:putative transposase
MAYVKILIHAVWATKNRHPFFTKEIRPIVWQHIYENAQQKGIFIDSVNGHADHAHCLFYLNADMSLSKHMQLIKGESSFWINKSGLLNTRFEWAEEYFAASVSDNKAAIVRNYINNQEEHHRIVPFQEEYNRFLKHYGFEEQYD